MLSCNGLLMDALLAFNIFVSIVFVQRVEQALTIYYTHTEILGLGDLGSQPTS